MTNFIIPITFANVPAFITGSISEVKNPNRQNYGKFKIYTDSHYEPLNFDSYFTESEVRSIIEANKGIFVKENFDTYSFEDIKEIKSALDVVFYSSYVDRLTFED